MLGAQVLPIGSTKPNFSFAHCALATTSRNGGKKSALSDVDLGSCAPKSSHQSIRRAQRDSRSGEEAKLYRVGRAFDPDEHGSLSSSMRYLLLSFVAMAIMLFGILLLYAATGSMELAVQGQRIAAADASMQTLIGLGLIMVFIGMAFKISIFPFHAWAPEVYRGARLFVISYLVVIVKSVVVIYLMRMAFHVLGTPQPSFTSIITFMAIFSMWIGNGMMLRETNFIRMLAFLSIGHLGALMIPILARNSLAFDAIFLDIIAFGITMLLVLSSLKGLARDRARGLLREDFQGLYYRHPWASITLAIALISLSGFPLTAGFVGKFALFQAGVTSAVVKARVLRPTKHDLRGFSRPLLRFGNLTPVL